MREAARWPAGDRTIVAHRGVPARHPENSAASFLAALEAGAMAVELDVRLTADGLLVVLHDPSPKRMTGVSTPASATRAEDLVKQTLKADARERLILLDEALALLAGRTVVDIEVKSGGTSDHEREAAALLDALYRAGSPRDVIVTSQDEALIRTVKAHAPLLSTGLVHRARDSRDPVAAAKTAGAELIVANRVRCGAKLLRAAARHGLRVWAYTVNSVPLARQLLERGCHGIVTDDYPSLADALAETPEPSPAVRHGRTLLVVDLGSSSTKAALIDTRRGIVALATRPTPIDRPAPGRVEHDAARQLDTVREVMAELAERATAPPAAAAIASQRSTGLWVEPGSLAPLTPAVSWQDERGASVVGSLEPDRERLESIAGLPLAPAWTAVTATALARESTLPVERRLLPLGCYVAAHLTGLPPRIDPTLANRTFLVDAASQDWSRELLAAFGITRDQLPELVPSVADHGALAWPGGGSVPLRVLIGDQQAAYVGACGPTGRGLVVNLGTGGFVMRAAGRRGPVPTGARTAPLWTSSARPSPSAFLVELPVAFDDEGQARSGPDAAMRIARRIALGNGGPAEYADSIGAAARVLVGMRDRSAVLAGGMTGSPHMRHLIAGAIPLETAVAKERELTALGAGRLAAAGLGETWGVPPAGGLLFREP